MADCMCETLQKLVQHQVFAHTDKVCWTCSHWAIDSLRLSTKRALCTRISGETGRLWHCSKWSNFSTDELSNALQVIALAKADYWCASQYDRGVLWQSMADGKYKRMLSAFFGVHLGGGDVDFSMASGDCVCDQCSKPYRKHPIDSCHLAYDGWPYLHVLCDGSRVKLQGIH